MSQEQNGNVAVDSSNKINIEDFKASADFKTNGVLAIAMAMTRTDISQEDRYKLSKLMLETTKAQFIDPMKDLRDREKEEEQQKAEAIAKAVAQFRDKINEFITDQLLDDIAAVAEDYIKAGHGKVISIEIFAKEDPEDHTVKAEFTSNIAKPRARKSTIGRTRDAGTTGAGVTVVGTPKEGALKLDKSPCDEIELTKFSSFAEAARILGLVDDQTNMKGLNCKRLLESKGYDCGYVQAEKTNGNTVGQTVTA